MIQTLMLFIAAFGLASSAAYFSVFGLAMTFSASFNSMLVIATFIEFAKVITIGFLYRNWSILSIKHKILNLVLVTITMIITSFGVAGHLLSSYQMQAAQSTTESTIITSYEAEIERLIDRKKQIDDQIAAFKPEFVTGRQRLIESFSSEKTNIDQRIDYLTQEIPKLKVESISKEAKLGPIIFVADILGYDKEVAVFVLVILLVLIIDPLAVLMMLNANFSLLHGKTKSKDEKPVVEIPSPEFHPITTKEELPSPIHGELSKILRS